MKIDKKQFTKTEPRITSIDMRGPLFIAGFPENYSPPYLSVRSKDFFRGSLRSLRINEKQVDWLTPRSSGLAAATPEFHRYSTQTTSNGLRNYPNSPGAIKRSFESSTTYRTSSDGNHRKFVWFVSWNNVQTKQWCSLIRLMWSRFFRFLSLQPSQVIMSIYQMLVFWSISYFFLIEVCLCLLFFIVLIRPSCRTNSMLVSVCSVISLFYVYRSGNDWCNILLLNRSNFLERSYPYFLINTFGVFGFDAMEEKKINRLIFAGDFHSIIWEDR